jgi:hypothetical protein
MHILYSLTYTQNIYQKNTWPEFVEKDAIDSDNSMQKPLWHGILQSMHACKKWAMQVCGNKIDRPPFYLWLGERETALELQKCVLQVQTSEKARFLAKDLVAST